MYSLICESSPFEIFSVDKPVRLMMEDRESRGARPGCTVDWEEEEGKQWDWETSDNARTQQRMKKMKEKFK